MKTKSPKPGMLALLLATACSPSSAGTPADTAVGGSTENMNMTGSMEVMDSTSPIRITARQASLAGVTFAVVRDADMERTIRAAAMVTPDERRLGLISARVRGWVERLYVNETGMYVDSGAPLFDLYSPDLVTAQEELLLAHRLSNTASGESLVAAARRRLEQWNISEDVIEAIERDGVQRRLVIRSPYRGNVLEKSVVEGQLVDVGQHLFTIADLSEVWIEPAVFEQDISLIRVGQRATASFDGIPGRQFEGVVSFIHPTLDGATRTLRVRIAMHNPGGLIKPMMFGTVRIHARSPRTTTVPLTAVLPTGDGDLAFVLRNGAVTPVTVTVGIRGDSSLVVFDGLVAGDTVVSSATFLFDSESSLAAAMAGIMLDMGMGLDMGGMDMGGATMDGINTGDSGNMGGDSVESQSRGN